MREAGPNVSTFAKDLEFLRGAISESYLAARKCAFFAELAKDAEVKKAFAAERENLQRWSAEMENLYDRFTRG